MSEAKRAPVPALKKETVASAVLGDVIVSGLKLSQRIALNRAGADADGLFFARLLAICVTDLGGRPLYTEDEWDIFGAAETAAVNEVLDVALRLGGFEGGEAKNA